MSADISPATGSAEGLVIEGSTATFQADVLEASMEVPVLVDFWAPWCGPCKQLTPALESTVKAFGGKIRLVKINVDENQGLAGQMGVQSIPAVFAFLGGRPVDGFMGALPASEVQKFAQKMVDAAAQAGLGVSEEETQIAAALEAAEAALVAEDTDRAQQIFGAILQHAPDNAEALVGLARVLFATGDADGAGATLDMLPETYKSAEADALRTAIALAGEAARLGDPTALENRLAADADDHQARFDLAMIRNAQGDKLGAAEALVELMRRDRDWNEDGARRKLLELFEAWGPKDPATVKGRRMLSALLFR